MTENSRPDRRGRFIPSLFYAGDLIIVNIVFWLTISVFPELKESTRVLRELWLLVNVSFIPMAFMSHLSDHEQRAIAMERVVRTTLLAVGTHFICFLLLQTFLRLPFMGYQPYALLYGSMIVAVVLFRTIGNYCLKSYRRRGFNFTRVVIVGTGSSARLLYSNMEKDTGFGYRVLGFFDDEIADGFNLGPVKSISELEEFVRDNHVRQIFFTLSGHHEALPTVIKIADDHVADFYYVPQIPKTFSRRLELNNIGAMPVLSSRRNPLKSILNRAVKRTFDIVVSGTFLCFYPLIYIPVAIAIKMSSPGPVYFKQERTGYLGKSFTCLKFRTMRVNKNADKAQATQNDPRKARIGDFLRRSSLDELPQFINVFKGEMSVVGPRPHMLKHTEDYTRVVDRYMVRHAVKPGITGWAQVNGYRGITDQLWKMERRVEHDVWYIENWTFLLDLKIMVRTVINAIQGEQNAF